MVRLIPLLFVFLFLIQACGTAPKPRIEPEIPKEVEKEEPQEITIKKTARPPVIILLSEMIPAYQQVADELVRILPDNTIVVLLASEAAERETQRKLMRQEGYQQFVAIGLEAAQIAKSVAGAEDEVVFCQVFNHRLHNIAGPMSKGVGALPGGSELFKQWRSMSPGLKRVLVMTGSDLDEVISLATEQAKEQGIELVHRVVENDKVLLFTYKEMASAVDGIWLLPDNRILSGRTIRDVLAFSVRNGKQVAAFSDEIFRLGALLSVKSKSTEIAGKVVHRLDEAYQAKGFPGPELVLLEHASIKVNDVAAKRYNIKYIENKELTDNAEGVAE
ncbi:MAG: hypothetical protein OEZ16_01060 [Chromatiales bacterium]|nr:hypothetical protein [Chromatiales bacterium]